MEDTKESWHEEFLKEGYEFKEAIPVESSLLCIIVGELQEKVQNKKLKDFMVVPDNLVPEAFGMSDRKKYVIYQRYPED